MRIVLITDQYHPMVGGVPSVTRRLAAALAAHGEHVWVVAPSEGQRDVRSLEEGVTVYRWASLPWPPYEGQRLALATVSRLRHLLKDIKPDVAHIHSPVTLGAATPRVAHSLGIPVVATNHYMPINTVRSLAGDGPLARGFTRLVYGYLKRLYNACDYVTFPTTTARNLLLNYGLRTPSEVISNGVELERYYLGPRDERLRQALGLPSGAPLALTVTRLMREKRVDVVLRALARIRAPLHLVIAGDGPDRHALRSLACQLGVSQRVTFLNFVPDELLAPLYRLVDVFVIASVAELQSLAALEAMASGLPIIAADAGALPELIAEGHNGYLFPADNSAQLAHVMEALLEQPEQWQAMGRESARIAAAHDYALVVERWEAIYRGVASRSLGVARRAGAP